MFNDNNWNRCKNIDANTIIVSYIEVGMKPKFYSSGFYVALLRISGKITTESSVTVAGFPPQCKVNTAGFVMDEALQYGHQSSCLPLTTGNHHLKKIMRLIGRARNC
jgi:hypothetical protein